jgi:3-phenylpropionate/trans-cinnamate dioxygenase ferredoxin reductase subunit
MEPRHVDALLIGGGVAAARCARSLRRSGFTGSILLVGDEEVPPYNRPALSKELLRDEVSRELVLAEPESWYARRGVELLLGRQVTSLDPGERLTTLADGTQVTYGSCLLATGAAPCRLDVPGGGRALLLRTLADAEALRRAVTPGSRAVVVGGGFIGVEVSASLAARGAEVTLLSGGPLLWSGAFGAAVSHWTVERLAAAGVSVRFDALVTEVSDAGAHIGSELVPADVVAAGVGVIPRVDLAPAAGLAVDDGVLVDERQATSAPGVFAAGDVARPRHAARVEHWHAARESGERAGLAMAGADVPARRAPWIFSEFGAANLDAVGQPVPDAEEVAVAPGVIGFVQDGILVQVVILDGAFPVEAARALVERGSTASELSASIP